MTLVEEACGRECFLRAVMAVNVMATAPQPHHCLLVFCHLPCPLYSHDLPCTVYIDLRNSLPILAWSVLSKKNRVSSVPVCSLEQ
jgi:hypothetical protein